MVRLVALVACFAALGSYAAPLYRRTADSKSIVNIDVNAGQNNVAFTHERRRRRDIGHAYVQARDLDDLPIEDLLLEKRAKPKAAAKPAAKPKAAAPAAKKPVAAPKPAAKKPAPAAKAPAAAKANGKEEYWFRFEDAGVATAGSNILPLAPRAGSKDFDDQAYKFISTDAAKVTRTKISGRVPTVYVLPAGTRASLVGQAKDFEVERDAKRAATLVVKDNEPGDLGIQGIVGTTLADFRSKVIRTVVKKTSAKAGGKATFVTITKGKASNTATQPDQAALARFS